MNTFHASLCFCLFLVVFSSCKKTEPSPVPVPTPPVEPNNCPLSPSQKDIITEVQAVQHSFESADPTIPETSLDPLIDYLGTSKIAGLGEATHGSKEFYQMKDKIFRQLVQQKGFKAIVFELPWGNCQVVNEYVFGNEGSLEAVVNQIPYWIYNTQEVADLIEWMHGYNMDKSDAEKIHFLGNDPQGANFDTELKILHDFIEVVAPDSLTFVQNQLEDLPSNLFSGEYSNATEYHEKNKTGTEAVSNLLQDNADEWIAIVGEQDYKLAVLAMKIIMGREEVYRTRNHGTLRDQIMAEVSEDWRQLLGTDAKIAVWAHNFHVADNNINQFNQSMGHFLKNIHDDDYKIVAFGFGRGSLNAFLTDGQLGFAGAVREQTVEHLVCNSVNHLLYETEGEQHYLIFEELEVSSNLFQFLVRSQEFLNIGAGFNPSFLNRHFYLEQEVLRANDALIFFDVVQASELR